MRSFLITFSAAVAMLLMSSQASAQVLIYQIKFDHAKGINYNPFEGGFFVAPLLGGTSSFLLTSTDGAHTFTTSASGGQLFTALGPGGGDKKAVMSATTGSSGSTTTTTTSTASGAMVAIGDINHKLSVNTPTQSLTVRVARKLDGTAVSADNESSATTTATDGSIGSAGTSEIRLELDEQQTHRANTKGFSLSQAVDSLKLLLEQAGFTDSASTTTTTGTTTTTTTN